jgi:hypothetical protein
MSKWICAPVLKYIACPGLVRIRLPTRNAWQLLERIWLQVLLTPFSYQYPLSSPGPVRFGGNEPGAEERPEGPVHQQRQGD